MVPNNVYNTLTTVGFLKRRKIRIDIPICLQTLRNTERIHKKLSKIQGRAKVCLQLGARETEFILCYCIILYTNNCELTFMSVMC